MEQPHSVGPGTRVSISYTVRDEDGDVVDEAPPDDPVTYIHGFGQILPALERRIEGFPPGRGCTFTVTPDEGYGDHDPDGIFQVPRSEFPDPAAITLEDEFVIDDPDGEEMLLRVIDFTEDDHVLVDANHPLAGVTLSFEVTVHGVEPATDSEIDEAEQALMAGGFSDGRPGGPPAPGAGLVQLSRKPKERLA